MTTIEELREIVDSDKHFTTRRWLLRKAAEEIEALQKEVADEHELRIMQLAGISTASLQNTDSTVKDRIGKDNPYCSQAYLDVCVAIDREMKLRNERNDLRRQNAELRECLKELKAACIDVLIPTINDAIKQGFKMETWTPEQMQWAKAVETTDKALAAQPEGGAR